MPRFKDVNRHALEILENIGLLESKDRPASELSHGEKRYLEIGLALATRPELLLLDEPTAGMSPSETLDAKAFIKRIFDETKIAIMLIEHDMSVVMDISHDIMVLAEGKVLAEGSPEEISANRLVQEVYLGGGPMLTVDKINTLLWQQPHSARHLPGGSPGGDRGAFGAKWRGEKPPH